jgi:hypothetical protein
MPRSSRDEEFPAFVQARRTGLVRLACLLAAGDTHLAEDLGPDGPRPALRGLAESAASRYRVRLRRACLPTMMAAAMSLTAAAVCRSR